MPRISSGNAPRPREPAWKLLFRIPGLTRDVSIAENLLIGVGCSIWTTLLALAVVPLYLKQLGLEAYGVIGLVITLQGLLQSLDLGLAPTLNREVARSRAAGDPTGSAGLLRCLEVIYWLTAALIAATLVLAAPGIASRWLKAEHLTPQSLSTAMAIIGLIVAFRWPIGIYQGALMGAERLALSNFLTMGMTTIGALGAAAIISWFSPTLNAFLLWQALVGVVFAGIARHCAWRVAGKAPRPRFDWGELRRVWRFSAGMALITAFAVVFTQVDKLLLSRLVSLTELGYYILATTMASTLYLIVTPMFNVMYPRFTSLAANHELPKLERLYTQGTRLLVAAVFPLAAMLILGGRDLTLLWTRDREIANHVAPILALLAAGSALHAVMYFPYALQLAFGRPRIANQINATLLVVLVPLLVWLARTYGAVGGALAWLVLHVLYVAIGSWWTHKHILPALGLPWFTRDVCLPLVLALVLGLAGWEALRMDGLPMLGRLVLAGSTSALIALAIVATSGDLRRRVVGLLRELPTGRFGSRLPPC